MNAIQVIQLVLTLPPVYANLLSVDLNYPELSSTSQYLKFHHGGPAFILASNNLIRFNYRGIQYLPQGELVLDQGKGWSKYSCNASAYSLCITNYGHLFPSKTPLVGTPTPLGLSCSHSNGKSIVNQPVYDISSCDILDESVEIVYTPNTIFIRHSYMPTALYLFYIVCCIYLVRSLSLNVISKLDHTVEVVQYPTVLVVLTIWIIALIDGDSYYATRNDVAFYWCTIVYVLLYLVFHGYHVYCHYYYNTKRIPRVFNMSAATMQLVVMRLYGITETPYAGVIIAIIATRIWEKELNKKRTHIFTGLIDCIYISLLMHMGFSYSSSYLFPLIVGAKLLAEKLHYRPVKKS